MFGFSLKIYIAEWILIVNGFAKMGIHSIQDVIFYRKYYFEFNYGIFRAIIMRASLNDCCNNKRRAFA